MAKPSLFIGSSSEGLEFARAIRGKLDNTAEITLWEDEFFALGKTFIESLADLSADFDFAILVFTGDDLINSRNTETFGPRDNVIFELGLFMGVLGRDRCFIVHQANTDLKIPSDLAGIATAKYNWPRADNNYSAAVGTACDAIRKIINSKGFNERKTQKKLKIIEAEQTDQRQNIEALSFIVSHFIPKYEIEHLKSFSSNEPFNYNLHTSFQREIRHLLDMQFIVKKHNFSFASLPQRGNLKDYFEVSDIGKYFIHMRDKFNNATPTKYDDSFSK
jgi:hypothetical protein